MGSDRSASEPAAEAAANPDLVHQRGPGASSSLNHPEYPSSIPRSCYNCHRRKIRCDKQELCSPCSRTNKSCVYPPPGQRIRRPRRSTMAWVSNRLSNLERYLPAAPTVAVIGAGSQGTGLPTPSPRPDVTSFGPNTSSSVVSEVRLPTEASDDCKQAFGDEVLVQSGSQTQYFNETFLSKVIEEQQDIQSAFTTPRRDWQDRRQSSVYEPMGILSAISDGEEASSFFPAGPTGLKLWNVYRQRIDSCSGLKVVHIPTDEVKVCTTIDDPTKAQPADLALSFAIFYAAIAVLEPAEAEALLGEDMIASQLRCKAGLERALADAEVLEKPTRTLLCALSIYLSALRLHNRSKSIWVLNGLALRIAQSIGFHRDGERLGLSPFESELRRRVWWHFLARDSSAAEDYGLQKLGNPRSDAAMPLNVEDADLDPDMKVLPPSRPALTAMSFPLVSYHIACAVHRLAGIVATSTPSSPPPESLREQIIGETKDHVERCLQKCNPVIPRHRLALLVSRAAIRKADLVTRLQWQALRSPNTIEALVTEENLTEALEVLEMVLQMWNDEMLKPYSWLWKSAPEYHVSMYLLWHLSVRPSGPNVDRAWNVVERMFAVDTQFSDGWGPRGAVLATLKAKAEMKRAGERAHHSRASEAPRQAIDAAQTPLEQQGEPRQPRSAAQNTAEDGGDEWPRGPEEELDWGSIAGTLFLDSQDFPGLLWQ